MFFVVCENCEFDIFIFKEVLDNIVCVDCMLIKFGGLFFMVGCSGVGWWIVVVLVVYMYNI